MKKILLDRGLILIVILLFLGMSIYPIQASSTTLINQKEKPGEIFFGLKSHIDITWDENEALKPIMPLSEVRKLSFNISYWVTWGIFGRITNYFLRDYAVIINIEIIDKPEYCDASISQKELFFLIPNKQNIIESSNSFIHIVLYEKAPAYEEFNITIQATMDLEIKGPLGFVTFLSPAKKTVNITLIPDYWGVFNYELPEGTLIETPPLIEKQLPIEIKNIANGKTIIESEIIINPPDFIIYFDPEELIIEVGETKTMYLKVIAPSNFSGRETIRTYFTPHFYYNYSLVGPLEVITFHFYYDTS